MKIPKSYNQTKIRYLLAGLCVQCGLVSVNKFRWCVWCRKRINQNGKR